MCTCRSRTACLGGVIIGCSVASVIHAADRSRDGTAPRPLRSSPLEWIPIFNRALYSSAAVFSILMRVGAPGRSCVKTARADQPVVFVLFDDVRAPAADAGTGKERRV